MRDERSALLYPLPRRVSVQVLDDKYRQVGLYPCVVPEQRYLVVMLRVTLVCRNWRLSAGMWMVRVEQMVSKMQSTFGSFHSSSKPARTSEY